MQTRSRHRSPPLTIAQIADLARTLGPPLATKCRLHPDDWHEILRRFPPGTLPKTPGSISLRADLGIGSPFGHFTEIRIVLDVDAPRVPRKGGPA